MTTSRLKLCKISEGYVDQAAYDVPKLNENDIK